MATVNCNLPYEFGTKCDVIDQDTQEFRGTGLVVGYVVYDDEILVLVGNPKHDEIDVDAVTGMYSMAEVFPIYKNNIPKATVVDFPVALVN